MNTHSPVRLQQTRIFRRFSRSRRDHIRFLRLVCPVCGREFVRSEDPDRVYSCTGSDFIRVDDRRRLKYGR